MASLYAFIEMEERASVRDISLPAPCGADSFQSGFPLPMQISAPSRMLMGISSRSPFIADAEEVFRFVSWISREHYIDDLYSMGHYREVFFLIGLIDYVNKQHDLKTDTRFDAYRKYCLDIPVYALSTLEEYDDADMLDEAKEYAETFAIPEFAAFNIFMTEDDIRPED